MEIVSFILLIALGLLGGVFGMLSSKQTYSCYDDGDKQKGRLSIAIFIIGLAMTITAIISTGYSSEHTEYNTDKFEVQYDTIYTGRNQLDSNVVFKIIKK